MKKLFLLGCMMTSLTMFASKQHLNNKLYREKQESARWLEQNLPFHNDDSKISKGKIRWTNSPRKFDLFAWLVCLCGSAVMLSKYLSPQPEPIEQRHLCVKIFPVKVQKAARMYKSR